MKERVESPLRDQAAVEAATAETPSRLHLRPLTGWEEEYVERHQTEANTARLCNEVLARCLVEPGEHPGAARQTVRELLVAERDRELVELRRLSLGPEIKARVSCPSCGEPGDVAFSLDALPLDFELPPRRLTVHVAGVGDVVLRLPTAGDQEDLADAELDGEAEQRSWLLARCIVRYGDRTDVDLDVARSLPVRVRTTLASALESAMPDLDLELDAACSHCGASFRAPFDVHVFFFFELSDRARLLLRDVYRVARACHWSERDILSLAVGRRLAYLALVEEEADTALFAELGMGAP